MRKLAQQIEFMASLKVFSNWSYNAVKNVYYACNLREFKRGQIIFKEGDEVDGFYMIKSGEFKVDFYIAFRIVNDQFYCLNIFRRIELGNMSNIIYNTRGMISDKYNF